LDVYHATLYLDKVMLALGWDVEKRRAERCSWLRGDINAKVWSIIMFLTTLSFGLLGLTRLKQL
jgi:hypothetical protein